MYCSRLQLGPTTYIAISCLFIRQDVTTVINFSFPNNTEDYVHRIGRTGRAGASGTSYTFLNQKDMENRRNMSDLVGVLTRGDVVRALAAEA